MKDKYTALKNTRQVFHELFLLHGLVRGHGHGWIMGNFRGKI